MKAEIQRSQLVIIDMQDKLAGAMPKEVVNKIRVSGVVRYSLLRGLPDSSRFAREHQCRLGQQPACPKVPDLQRRET